MLTIVVMMSGPHRYEMLKAAIASIPLDCELLTHVILQHQGGRWDWGASLRQQIEQHPKVRILEFSDRVGVAASFNRTLEHVVTPWVLMLPDDDFLLSRTTVSGLNALATYHAAAEFGLFAFGWYYTRSGRYLHSHVKGRGLLGALYYTPKMCSTFVNMKKVRELGGFDESLGGFTDTALFGRLCFEYDAVLCETPIGVYRLHNGQLSAAPSIYSPFATALFKTFCGFAEDARERGVFEKHVTAYGSDTERMLTAPLRYMNFLLKSRTTFDDAQIISPLRSWSSAPRVADPLGLRSLLR
jgi:hypothetical protein